jgi:5'-nucleotidase
VLGRLGLAVACTLIGCVSFPVTAAAQPTDTVDVRLLAFNDFRGSLLPPEGSSGVVEQTNGTPVEAGGAAYLAAFVKQLRTQAENSLLYSVGDNWGSAGLESSMFHDEPVVDVLNSMGVTASGIGNMELVGGYNELLRLQHGGCHPVDGCRFRPEFTGASFPMLAANLTLANGTPATLPFTVNFVDDVPVGVIGVLPRDAEQVNTPDLAFGDELSAIDRTADLLDFFGVKTIALLLHKGDDSAPGGPDACNLTTSAARRIAEQASSKVDAVFTAGGNRQHNCTVTDPAGYPRAFMQGASNGRGVSVIDVVVDRATKDVLRDRTSSFNQIVTHDIAPDRPTADLVESAKAQVALIAQNIVGSISSDIVRDRVAGGESALGNLIADAQLAATTSAGAQLALTNPGGIRADLNMAPVDTESKPGLVDYGEVFAAQPFANPLRVLTLTGAQLKAVLEQQFGTRGDGTVRREVLAPSATVHYVIDHAAPVGFKVADLAVGGVPVADDAVYRVAVNSFLASGGDGFTAFKDGRDVVDAGNDTDALTRYLVTRSPVAPPATDRIGTR